MRQGHTGDAEQIALVHIRTWQTAYRGQLPSAFLDSLDSDLPRRSGMWAAHISKDPPLLVAEVDGRVVGFVSYGPSRDDDAGDQVAELYAI
jgi:L-amino acid N-acyltransferase YncA